MLGIAREQLAAVELLRERRDRVGPGEAERVRAPGTDRGPPARSRCPRRVPRGRRRASRSSSRRARSRSTPPATAARRRRRRSARAARRCGHRFPWGVMLCRHDRSSRPSRRASGCRPRVPRRSPTRSAEAAERSSAPSDANVLFPYGYASPTAEQVPVPALAADRRGRVGAAPAGRRGGLVRARARGRPAAVDVVGRRLRGGRGRACRWRCCSQPPSGSPSARGRRRGGGRELQGVPLAGSTVGIVGAGGIGREIIRRLEPFDVRVVASTRSGAEVPGAARSLGPGRPRRAADRERLRRAVRAADAGDARPDRRARARSDRTGGRPRERGARRPGRHRRAGRGARATAASAARSWTSPSPSRCPTVIRSGASRGR